MVEPFLSYIYSSGHIHSLNNGPDLLHCLIAPCSLCVVQINGVSVVCASHEYVVQLIRDAVDQLVLTVVTVNESSAGAAEGSLRRVDGVLNGHAHPGGNGN